MQELALKLLVMSQQVISQQNKLPANLNFIQANQTPPSTEYLSASELSFANTNSGPIFEHEDLIDHHSSLKEASEVVFDYTINKIDKQKLPEQSLRLRTQQMDCDQEFAQIKNYQKRSQYGSCELKDYVRLQNPPSPKKEDYGTCNQFRCADSIHSFGPVFNREESSPCMASEDNSQRPYFRQQSTEDCPQLLQSIQDLYKLLKVTNENTFKFGPITYKLDFMDSIKPASLSEKSSLLNTSNLTTVQEESRLLIASDPDETGDQNQVGAQKIFTLPKISGMQKTFSDKVKGEQQKLLEKQESQKNMLNQKQPAQKQSKDSESYSSSSNFQSSEQRSGDEIPAQVKSPTPNRRGSTLSVANEQRHQLVTVNGIPYFQDIFTDRHGSQEGARSPNLSDYSKFTMTEYCQGKSEFNFEQACTNQFSKEKLSEGQAKSELSAIDVKQKLSDNLSLYIEGQNLIDQFKNVQQEQPVQEPEEIKIEEEIEKTPKLQIIEKSHESPLNMVKQDSQNSFYTKIQKQVALDLEIAVPLKGRKKAHKKKSFMSIAKQSSVQLLEIAAQTKSPQSTVADSPLPSEGSLKSPAESLNKQFYSLSNDSQPNRLTTPNKLPLIPHMKMSSTGDTNKSLPIIKEDEREHKKIDISENDNDFSKSSITSEALGDKSSISAVNLLPYLHRDNTKMSNIVRPNTNDPLINLIFKMASSFKLNPYDIISEQRKPEIRVNDTEEQKENFTQHSQKVKQDSLNFQNIEYEVLQIRSIYEQSRSNKMKRFESDYESPHMIKKKLIHKSKSSTNCLKLKAEFGSSSSKHILTQDDHGPSEDPSFEAEVSEINKLKIQTQILSLALRKNLENLKSLENDLKQHINTQTDQINRHEKKVKLFMENLVRQNKELHFAFLFACPLVLSCGQIDQEKYKLVPGLDYEKEYNKIKQRLEVAQCQITITKRQCTTESFRQVLMRRPLGIHFSGHGILNNFESVGDYHAQVKDEGDFLLFETDEGDSQLVSRNQLKNLIERTEAELDFVFVASCHSEFVGRIFLEAGVKHVICIDHNFEVEDDAIMTFTEAFYDAIFSNKMCICQAFYNAQLAVSISNSPEQADIFKLLVKDYLINENGEKMDHTTRSQVLSVAGSSVQTNMTFGELINTKSTGSNKNTNSTGSNKLSCLKTSHSKSSAQSIKKENSGSRMIFTQGLKKHTCRTFGKFPKGMYNEVNQNEPTLQIGSIEQPVFVGRQKDMFKLIQKILSPKSSRLLTLLGLPGIGKSSLARKTIQHIIERKLLPGGYIILNVRGIKDCEVFLRAFNNSLVKHNPLLFDVLRLSKDNSRKGQQESLCITDLILSKITATIQGKVLLVIDNATDLITSDKTNFKNLIQFILTQVPTMTILLTTRCRLKFQSDLNEEIILLYGLPAIQSMTLFTQLTRTLNNREINELLKLKPDVKKYPSERSIFLPKKLHEHHLFRMIGGNPLTIVILAPMLTDTERAMDLVGLYKTLCDDQLTQEYGEDPMMALMRSSVHISLQSIQNSDPECLELLYLLSLLPEGIIPKELDVLWKAYKDRTGAERFQDQFQNSVVSAIEGEEYNFQSDCKWKRAFLKLRKQRLIQEREVQVEETVTRSSKVDQKVKNWMEDTILSLPVFVSNFAEAQITSEMYQVLTAVLSDYFKREFNKIYERCQNSAFVINDAQLCNSKMSCRINELEGNFWAFIDRMVEAQQEIKMPGEVEQTIIDSEDGQQIKSPGTEQTVDGKANLNLNKETTSSKVNLGDDSSNDFSEQIQLQIQRQSTQRKKLQYRYSKPLTSDGSSELASLDPSELARSRWRTAINLVISKNQRQQLNGVKQGEWDTTSDSDSPEPMPIDMQLFIDLEKMKETQDSPQKKPERTLTVESKKSERSDWISQLKTFGSQKRSNKDKRHLSIRRADTNFASTKTIELARIDRNNERQCISRANTRKYAQIKRHVSMLPRRMQTRISMIGEFAGSMQDDELAIVYYIATLVLLEQYSLADSIIEKQLLKLTQSTATLNGNIRRLQGLSKLQMLRVKVQRLNLERVANDVRDELHQKVIKVKHCYERAEFYFGKESYNKWGLALTHYQHAELLYFAESNSIASDRAGRFLKFETTMDRNALLNTQRQKLYKSASVEEPNQVQEQPAKSNFEQAMHKLQLARFAFQQINHHRGLALTFKLASEFKKLNSVSKHKIKHAQSFQPDRYETLNSLLSEQLPFNNEDTTRLEALYQKHMLDFREQQRHLQPFDMRQELCITRLQGESVSLNVEIVRGVPDSQGIFKTFYKQVQHSTSSYEEEFDSSQDNQSQESIQEEEQKIGVDDSIVIQERLLKMSQKPEAENFMGYQDNKVDNLLVPQSSQVPETPQFQKKKSSLKRKSSGRRGSISTKCIKIKEHFTSESDETVSKRLNRVQRLESPHQSENYYKSIPDSPDHSPSSSRHQTPIKRVPLTKRSRPSLLEQTSLSQKSYIDQNIFYASKHKEFK